VNTRCSISYHQEIRRQTTLEGAGWVLSECAESLGLDLAGFHVDKDCAELPRARNGEFIAIMMGWPTECVRGWCKDRLGQHCPVAQRCHVTGDAFHWSCDSARSSWFRSDLLPEHRRVLDHYGRYVAGGIAVPVHLASGRTGYVSWCSRSGDVAELAQLNLATLFLVSHTFIDHAKWLHEEAAESAAHLTSRERQCLTWAARGKSEGEIAAILRRSRDTVHFHIRNAMLKLDARNRTHAVAIACTRGLIRLS
jgi:DNA-binding CsgD family transcriptional regulator